VFAVECLTAGHLLSPLSQLLSAESLDIVSEIGIAGTDCPLASYGWESDAGIIIAQFELFSNVNIEKFGHS
jgi:hypothetical protein